MAVGSWVAAHKGAVGGRQVAGMRAVAARAALRMAAGWRAYRADRTLAAQGAGTRAVGADFLGWGCRTAPRAVGSWSLVSPVGLVCCTVSAG